VEFEGDQRMAADQDAQGRLTGVARRHLKLICSLAILATVLGVAGGLLLPASAKATATVLVSPLDGNPYSTNGRGDDLTNLQSEAALVQADAVEQVVRQKLRSADRSRVSVTVPPNTQVLQITYTGSSATAARDGAQAFANGYLSYRTQRAQSVLDARAAKLREQEKKVQQELTTTTKRLTTAPVAQKTLLRQRITAYNNQLGVIDEQNNDISATPVNPGSVITPAQPPTGSLTTRAAMFGGAGLAVGLFLGLLVALALERSDRRLRDARTVQRLGVPVLSTVSSSGGLVLVTAPKSRAGEAYRRLRAAVVASVQERPVSLLVTSATPAASATLTSSNLAVALAHAGSATIMVDASFSETSPSALFGLGQSKGLSDVLMRGTDPTQLLVHADSQLRLLPRGPGAGAAAERFSGPRMRETVRLLRDKAEYILINAPSVHDANAQALCTLADAVLIVVTLGQTTRADIEQAYTEAERAGAIVIGTVVEDSRVRRTGGKDSSPRSSGSHRSDNTAGSGAPQRESREPDYSPGTAVARGTRERPQGAPTPPATGNTSTTATSPDWSRFSGGDEAQQPVDTSDSTETAAHKAIEA
jgi:Mrp family chromosome partitioning ATPase/capsular polysaccharide biosynthesis protein